MRVLLIKKDRIRSTNIPDIPKGNYWITDYDENGKEVNVLNIKENNKNSSSNFNTSSFSGASSWELVSNPEFYCVLNGDYQPSFILKNNCFYNIKKASNNEGMSIYVCSSYDENSKDYYISPNDVAEITIGNDINSNIQSSLFDQNHAKLVYEDGFYVIYPLSERFGVYVNNLRVYNKKRLEYGDIIFINGVKIVYVKYQNNSKLNIYLNNNNVTINNLTPATYDLNEEQFTEDEKELDIKMYDDSAYFHKTPRFISVKEDKELRIDAPPEKEKENEMPVFLTVGPMLTMSLSSMVMAFTSISNLKNGNTSLSSALPSIVIALAMVASTLLWPLFIRKYEDRRRKKKEKERITKFSNYIDNKRKIIEKELINRATILKNDYPSLIECSKIILEKSTILWQKRIEDKDYLSVSLGYGNYPMNIKISYPEEQFSMDEDNLKQMAENLSREPKMLSNVPVIYSFRDNYISSIVGEYDDRIEYLKKILFQIITFHSYNDLKIIIFTDNDKKSSWKSIKNLPYCFSDDKKIRFFATKSEEYTVICSYLEKVFNERKQVKSEFEEVKYDKIYLIITDTFKKIRNQDFISNLLNENRNLGFSFIIANRNISTLPEQCKSFIKVDNKYGELLENVINKENQKFIIEQGNGINYNECYGVLSNIPIEVSDNSLSSIPEKVGFLEMYDVGKIEQLNSINRWNKSNPIETLQTPVGYGKNNELQYIDLHEKYHGPHGLIAGSTGSGKSEFIITYILSLSINYNPNEVQFILIDYKGGGLAGAFENANSGKKLPHLVGTITNLDATEIKRSLSSIESELKRRQKLFNLARNKTGESTIDIYKYQRLYREKKVDEPVSHLFIITDEFAELKNQEPEFMDQLISTARIGRSLGVHLILATQKPSGVVDPQIWSNTRFRICLRVQDEDDSNEVIKCPDAAYLTTVGRYYFQVGFNEVFTQAQSAYSGLEYIPKEKMNKSLDTSISFINNIGQVIKQTDTKVKNSEENQKKYGIELSNIVNYLSDLALSQNIKCKPLWLDRIPNFIKISELIKKYNYNKKDGLIEVPVGEYDVPQLQQQMLLKVSISERGNTIIYGATGAGKENFLMTLIYESLNLYSSEEINYYIMDFGSELLNRFSSSNYVGDIITIDEEEKILNFYKMINKIIEERKNILINYGGSFNNYNLNNKNNKIPNIVIIINNYEVYYDTYEEHEDILNAITRECLKYGIYFILTCNTPNGVRFKLRQNFSQIFCMQQNSEDDYSAVLGNTNHIFPSRLYGRGIVKYDNIYEFQIASIGTQDDINDLIDKMIESTNKKSEYKAKKVPILPDVVDYNYVSDYINVNSSEVIIGVEKQSLDISRYNFKKFLINVISANDISIMTSFSNALVSQLKQNNTFVPMVINATDIEFYDYVKSGITFEENNFNSLFERILKYENDCFELYKNNNYDINSLKRQKPILLVIFGIENFISKINPDNLVYIEDFFDKCKDLGIINFLIVDQVDSIKSIEYENWFKNNYVAGNGIWIGSGFEDQYLIKIITRTDEVKEDAPDDFCFVVNRGKPVLVKYVSEFKINDAETLDI